MLDRLAVMKHAAKVVPTLVSTPAGEGLNPLNDDDDEALGGDEHGGGAGAPENTSSRGSATSKGRKFRTAIEAFLSRIESLASDKHYDSRQLFCVICERELSRRPRRMFVARFMTLLTTLSTDRVPLVADAARAALAQDKL
jgi:hypothetical protein